MQDSKLHTRCPSCQADRDYDTDATRHYECGTVGHFGSRTYTNRCTSARCSSCGEVSTHAASCSRRVK